MSGLVRLLARATSASASASIAASSRAVYLRGPRGEDLSYCIQKVEFQLHPSFENPNRGARRRTAADRGLPAA